VIVMGFSIPSVAEERSASAGRMSAHASLGFRGSTRYTR
jgi:hypothetical protein